MRSFWPLAPLVVAACALFQTPDEGPLPVGTWGGKDAGMIVTDSGAHVHVGCTLGDVPAPITLDAHGHFDVPGSYNLTVHPVASGIFLPARFAGEVDLLALSLTITVDDTVSHRTVVLGPIRLRWGVRPEMGPCPICASPADRMRTTR